MQAVENPTKFIEQHLENQTKTNSRLRSLLIEMNSRKRVPVQEREKNSAKTAELSPYERMLNRNKNNGKGVQSAEDTFNRKRNSKSVARPVDQIQDLPQSYKKKPEQDRARMQESVFSFNRDSSGDQTLNVPQEF